MCSVCLPQSCGNNMGFTEAVTVGSHLYSLYWVQKPCESFEAFDEDGGKRGCTVSYIKAERAVVPRAPGVQHCSSPASLSCSLSLPCVDSEPEGCQ